MHKRIKITLMDHGLIIESEVGEEELLIALKLAAVMIERKTEEDKKGQQQPDKPQTNGSHNEVH